jgi:hypothetical protein
MKKLSDRKRLERELADAQALHRRIQRFKTTNAIEARTRASLLTLSRQSINRVRKSAFVEMLHRARRNKKARKAYRAKCAA